MIETGASIWRTVLGPYLSVCGEQSVERYVALLKMLRSLNVWGGQADMRKYERSDGPSSQQLRPSVGAHRPPYRSHGEQRPSARTHAVDAQFAVDPRIGVLEYHVEPSQDWQPRTQTVVGHAIAALVGLGQVQ